MSERSSHYDKTQTPLATDIVAIMAAGHYDHILSSATENQTSIEFAKPLGASRFPRYHLKLTIEGRRASADFHYDRAEHRVQSGSQDWQGRNQAVRELITFITDLSPTSASQLLVGALNHALMYGFSENQVRLRKIKKSHTFSKKLTKSKGAARQKLIGDRDRLRLRVIHHEEE